MVKIRQVWGSVGFTTQPKRYCPIKIDLGMSANVEASDSSNLDAARFAMIAVLKTLRRSLSDEVDACLQKYKRLAEGDSLGIWGDDEELPTTFPASLVNSIPPEPDDHAIEEFMMPGGIGESLGAEGAIIIRPGLYFAKYHQTWEVGGGDNFRGELSATANHEPGEDPRMALHQTLQTCKEALRMDAVDVYQRITAEQSRNSTAGFERRQYGRPTDIPAPPEHVPSVTMLI